VSETGTAILLPKTEQLPLFFFKNPVNCDRIGINLKRMNVSLKGDTLDKHTVEQRACV